MKVSLADANDKLPKLIKAAEKSQRITICRCGRPAANLVRTVEPEKKKQNFGTMRNKIIIHDRDWWKSLTVKEVDD